MKHQSFISDMKCDHFYWLTTFTFYLKKKITALSSGFAAMSVLITKTFEASGIKKKKKSHEITLNSLESCISEIFSSHTSRQIDLMEAVAHQVMAKSWQMILICRCKRDTLHHILWRKKPTYIN